MKITFIHPGRAWHGISLVIVLAMMAAPRVLPAAAVIQGLDPLQWVAEPFAKISSNITMTAETVASTNGVEYRFTCTAGGGPSSGWQSSPSYTATVSAQTKYTYQAEVRDRVTQSALREPSGEITLQPPPADRIDTAIGSEIEVISYKVTGNKNNRINLYITPQWHTGDSSAYNSASRRSEFVSDCNLPFAAWDPNSANAMLPYSRYSSFFNLYKVWWPTVPSWETATTNGWAGNAYALYQTVRNRLFTPWQTGGRGWVTAMVMLNGGGGGGGAGLDKNTRLGDAYIVGNDVGSFVHEFSHTAPCTGDEYTTATTGWRGAPAAPSYGNWWPGYRREFIPWRAWIDPNTPVPTPYSAGWTNLNATAGFFEGANYRDADCFRCSLNGCAMNVGTGQL